jgi:phage baseplate assembly protein W
MANITTEQDYVTIGEGANFFDDEAHFWTISRLRLTEFRDLDIKFGKNPSTGDVIVKTGDIAVKQSIKNLILTDFYERRMRPAIGSGIKKILFEPADVITEIRLKDLLAETITNHEPRANIENISVKTTRDGLGYDIPIVFTIIGKNQPITFNTFLEANRG